MFDVLNGEPEHLTYIGYLLAFILATITCFGTAWRARTIPYADTRRALVYFFSGSGAWGASYVGFLLVSSPLGKHLFYQLSLIVGFGTVWAWLWFCSAYSGRGLHRNRTVRRFAVMVFGTVTLLKVTNPLHGLYYGLETVGEPFGLVVTHGPLYWVVMALAYALSAAGYLMLYELFLKTETRTGPLAVLTGLTALPAVFNVIGHVNPSLLDITHEPLGVAVFAIGLLFAYTYQFSAVRVAGSLDAPSLIVGTGGQIRDLGGRTAEMFAHGNRELVGRPLHEALPSLARALNEGRSVWQHDSETGPRYYQITDTSLEDSRGNRVIVFSDITERERQRRALDRQNDLFKRAQSLAGVGAWEYDRNEDTLRWSDEVYRIFGVDERFEPTIESVIQLACPDHRAQMRKALRQIIEEKRPRALDVRLASSNGPANDCSDNHERPFREATDGTAQDESRAARWVRVRGGPRGPQRTGGASGSEALRNGESSEPVHLVRGAVQDITDQKRRERRLRASKEEAEEAARLKSAMLANMSHEIRTPLTSIIGFAEALGEEAEGQGGPTARFAALIEKSGRRLLDTLDGVLNLSKLEAGQMELEARPVDLREQVQEVADELRPTAEEKDLNLQVESTDTDTWVEADPGGVQIVLQNLVSNAIKYTETGQVRVRIGEKERTLTLEVEDTGIGINPDRAERLFEPFRQESEGMDREYEGTGLGLAVTKKAVDQMNGEIDVESTKGEGSRFTVRLPKAERERATNGR